METYCYKAQKIKGGRRLENVKDYRLRLGLNSIALRTFRNKNVWVI